MSKRFFHCKNSIEFVKEKLILTFVVILMFAFSGCEKILEVYIGMPLQPTNINSEYKPGLNVFGVLKASNSIIPDNQYFEVQYISELSDTSDISFTRARITITNRQSGNVYNLFHQGDGLYSNELIDAEPGERWAYRCIGDTFEVTSNTIVPNLPEISSEGIVKNGNTLTFSIKSDNSAFMYDITYADIDSLENMRVIPQPGIDTKVEFTVSYNTEVPLNYLVIIAYDKNYEQYITTSNIFFKPNAYRPRFTTVNGGYGCFGSLTSLEIDLQYALKSN